MAPLSLLMWFGVIALVVWAIGRHRYACAGGPSHSEHSGAEAREIARRRYAKGEITQEQYNQLMKDLD